MTQAQKIQAACEKYNTLSTTISNRVMDEGRYWSAEEKASFAAVESELMATLQEFGFTSYQAGKEWSSKRIGKVVIGGGSGSGLPKRASFTSATEIKAAAQRNAIRRQVKFHGEMY